MILDIDYIFNLQVELDANSGVAFDCEITVGSADEVVSQHLAHFGVW